MAIKEEYYIETDEENERGIALDFYRNEVSIVSARRGRDGNIYADYCYPQRYDKALGGNHPAEKAIPMKNSLGNSKVAYQRLMLLAGMLQPGKKQERKQRPDVPPSTSHEDLSEYYPAADDSDDSIPF